MSEPTVDSVEAWVNWNPDPELHAFGEQRQQRTIAPCGVTVRERRGMFDPAGPKVCGWCAQGLALGFDVDATRALRQIAADPAMTIVCRRDSGRSTDG